MRTTTKAQCVSGSVTGVRGGKGNVPIPEWKARWRKVSLGGWGLLGKTVTVAYWLGRYNEQGDISQNRRKSAVGHQGR